MTETIETEGDMVKKLKLSSVAKDSAKLQEISEKIIDCVRLAGGASVRSLGSQLIVDDDSMKELFILKNNYDRNKEEENTDSGEGTDEIFQDKGGVGGTGDKSEGGSEKENTDSKTKN